MNVASVKLCRKLYELSGWEPEPPFWKLPDATFKSRVPAYSLGYLLRKLPRRYKDMPLAMYAGTKGWEFSYGTADPHLIVNDYTPEDAACKLAIKLFKQRLLPATNPEK